MSRALVWLIGLGLLGMLLHISQPGPVFPRSPVMQPAGVIVAPSPPVQRALPAASAQGYHDLTLQPLATFEFDARLISLAWYSRGTEADYSPVDLGISWGPMSDSANIDALTWAHDSRFLTYRYADRPPIPQAELDRSIANLHVLPASDAVLDKIEHGGPGNASLAAGCWSTPRAPMAGTGTPRCCGPTPAPALASSCC